MRCFFLLLLGCLLLPAAAQDAASVPRPEAVAIAEAFAIGGRLAPRVWPGWEQAPFAVLLVAGEHEFLVRHPRPPGDFVPAGRNEVLNEEVLWRKRVFPPHLLASFPIEGIPTVVVGTREATGKHSTAWLITLLHEHFHQLQYSQPDYYEAVNALGLARGDQTGMWMLEYPFPYDSPELNTRFQELSRRLHEALSAQGDGFAPKAQSYLHARREFVRQLEPDDARYFSFQLWQEGVARYAELEMTQLAASEHQPGGLFTALPDFVPFAEHADILRRDLMGALAAARLQGDKRVAFYALGAAEALLLDRVSPQWKSCYLDRLFALEACFPP